MGKSLALSNINKNMLYLLAVDGLSLFTEFYESFDE